MNGLTLNQFSILNVRVSYSLNKNLNGIHKIVVALAVKEKKRLETIILELSNFNMLLEPSFVIND